MNQYKYSGENEYRKQTRLFVEDKVVTPIREGVDKAFAFDVKKFVDSLSKKD